MQTNAIKHAAHVPETRRLLICVISILVFAPALALAYSWLLRLPLVVSLSATMGLPSVVLFAAYWYQFGCGMKSRGAVVLDWGRHPATASNLFTGLLMTLVTTLLLCAFLATPQVAMLTSKTLPIAAPQIGEVSGYKVPATYAAAIVLFSVYPFCYITSAFGHLQIREKRVWAYYRLLSWEHIQYCKWEFGCTLIIQVRSKLPFSGVVGVHIPLEQMPSAIEELKKHCPVVE